MVHEIQISFPRFENWLSYVNNLVHRLRKVSTENDANPSMGKTLTHCHSMLFVERCICANYKQRESVSPCNTVVYTTHMHHIFLYVAGQCISKLSCYNKKKKILFSDMVTISATLLVKLFGTT